MKVDSIFDISVIYDLAITMEETDPIHIPSDDDLTRYIALWRRNTFLLIVSAEREKKWGSKELQMRRGKPLLPPTLQMPISIR